MMRSLVFHLGTIFCTHIEVGLDLRVCNRRCSAIVLENLPRRGAQPHTYEYGNWPNDHITFVCIWHIWIWRAGNILDRGACKTPSHFHCSQDMRRLVFNNTYLPVRLSVLQPWAQYKHFRNKDGFRRRGHRDRWANSFTLDQNRRIAQTSRVIRIGPFSSDCSLLRPHCSHRNLSLPSSLPSECGDWANNMSKALSWHWCRHWLYCTGTRSSL